MIFVTYDPVFRNVTGTGVCMDADAYRTLADKTGTAYIEVDDLPPGLLENLGVDGAERIVLLNDLPQDCRPDDIDSTKTVKVPAMPSLPSGGLVSPSIGTECGSGITYVLVRAPLCRSHRFQIHVYTAQDARDTLIAYARNRRWELEQAGAPYGKLRLATDDRCKLLIQTTVTAVDLMIKLGQTTAATWSTTWVFLDGKASIRRADLDTMTLALAGYVSGLFDACNAIEERIAAGKITVTAQIEAAYGDALAVSATKAA